MAEVAWGARYPGHTFDGRALRTIETPAGYAMRGECLTVTCAAHLCGHAQDLDLPGLARTAWADVEIRQLPLRCSRCGAPNPRFTRWNSGGGGAE
jgi:hypothetical protein